jgi:hypothetical protein
MTEASNRNYAIKVTDTKFIKSINWNTYEFETTTELGEAYRFVGKDLADNTISALYKRNKAVVAYKLET